MKKSVLSLFFALLFVLPLCAQKHEVGVLGGAMVGYGVGKANYRTMDGGFRAGAYYRYVPNRWVGVQSGLYYQYFNENRGYLVHRRALFNSLVIPVQAVVFPASQ